MKSGMVTIVLAIVVIAAGITYALMYKPRRPIHTVAASSAEPNKSSKVIQVKELVQRTEPFEGEIVLRGVVAGVNEAQGVFGVADAREFQAEGTICADDVVLPVRFRGDLPEPKTIVEITGQVILDKRGQIIEAQRVEIVP